MKGKNTKAHSSQRCLPPHRSPQCRVHTVKPVSKSSNLPTSCFNMDGPSGHCAEISPSQGDKRCMNTLTTPSIWSGQSHTHRKHKGGCQRQGHREMGVCAPRRWSSTFARSLQLRVCCLTMRIQLTYWKVHFEIAQMVNFTFCVF